MLLILYQHNIVHIYSWNTSSHTGVHRGIGELKLALKRQIKEDPLAFFIALSLIHDSISIAYVKLSD
ncbi:hypothetical protein L2744_00720 [Shewanella profunda]|uniref:hypothetical protein n=1 Tax=Shewanella profunda TaxID=254793 RepID=UPI002010BC4F|nr:hypothetical protein [Shewanella profunda]MCL1088156.1 hypothetical protein [Shewanella profunda]